jgi:hypothetical protein
MKISERTIERLGEIITGDKPRVADCPISPYRSGPQLVRFFNEFGLNEIYGQGFPSRWEFAQNCIRRFNGSPALRGVILAALDPRHFMSNTVLDSKTQGQKPANVQEAIGYLNDFLAFDGYAVLPSWELI